jgi:hypothetical protein
MNINFPTDLEALEHYLGLTRWMRNKISYYAQRADFLQAEKTKLPKGSPVKSGHKRKRFTKTTPIEKRQNLLNSFHPLQNAFSSPNLVVHFPYLRRLYTDVDASKRGYGVMVHHVKGDPTGNK